MVLLLSTCLVAFSLALLINLLVKILVEILLLLQLKSILSGDFCQSIERHQILVNILDWSGRHASANSISQVEVVLETEGPLAASKVILSEHNAVELVADSQVILDTSFTNFVN